MPIDMLLHDTRVLGRAPAIAENIYDFDGSVPMAHILGWTRVIADVAGGLRRLTILAHGVASADTGRGGWGLEFGAEWITFDTAHLFRNLRGPDGRSKVRAIIVFGCKALDIDAKYGQSGMMLWSQIAYYANCNVVGSPSTQYYDNADGKKLIEFHKWEGPVYVIAPNGNKQLIDPDFSLP